MEKILQELNEFLGKATLGTYAGSGPETDLRKSGFIELEFKQGKWRCRDVYTGFFRSWGQETVWLNEKPFWTQLYGGGMKNNWDEKFALQTFGFLKKALSAGAKIKMFCPRGPRTFSQGNWKYSSKWKGDIEKFSGNEKITFKSKVVFTHEFFGGLIVD